MKQNTVANEIGFSGTGLHSGVEVNIRIKESPENTGIVFRRVDIATQNNEIPALFSNVVNTQLGTTIANASGAMVQTIEHFMAALWACDIDNAIIEIDNRETPIMDGSSLVFINEIKKAGIKKQQSDRKYLKILKEIEVIDGDASIKILPSNEFKIELTVNYQYGGIGQETYDFNGQQDDFIEKVAKARTFCNKKEIEFMRQNGLALGGSVENAMIFDDEKILNDGGYRCVNEVVKHKLLDCVGDMFTSGYYINAKIIGNKSGHKLNNELLKKIFLDTNNYSIE